MTQAHSLLGASGASRWLACPGSFRLSQQVTAPPPSIYAVTGSVAHELIEEAITDESFKVDPLLLGTTRFYGGHTVEIDQEMIDACNVMLAYANSMISGKPLIYKAELKVSPRLPFPTPIKVFGSLDLIIADPTNGWFEIIDYKHGAGVPVSPDLNPQLLFYAAGALALLQEKAPRVKFKTALLTVVQPRVPGQPSIKSWDCDVLDLELWVADVLAPGIERCLDRDAPFSPGDHCRFCPGIAQCPALLFKAQTTAKGEFDDYTGQDPEPMTLQDQLDLADQLELWMESLRKDAKERIERNEHVPGWRLVPTRATRRWTNDELAVVLLNELGLPSDDIFDTKVRSPAQIEKIIAKLQGSKSFWDKKLFPIVEVHSSGTKLERTENDDFGLLNALEP